MTQDQIKHLEFIQGVINRMNSNSFQIKGWCITIVAALLALYAGSSDKAEFIFVAIAPTILFWISDAYCLCQERRFRSLYNAIVNGEDIKVFSMPIKDYAKWEKPDQVNQYKYFYVFKSTTIGGFYLLISLGLLFGGLALQNEWSLRFCLCKCCGCC